MTPRSYTAASIFVADECKHGLRAFANKLAFALVEVWFLDLCSAEQRAVVSLSGDNQDLKLFPASLPGCLNPYCEVLSTQHFCALVELRQLRLCLLLFGSSAS